MKYVTYSNQDGVMRADVNGKWVFLDDIEKSSTCEKCGEGEETELCPKCGAESYGNCPCKPKEEKIEMPHRPNSNPSTAESMNYVGDCILYLADKLNGDN